MHLHRLVYFFILLFGTLFFISCGSSESDSPVSMPEKSEYLSISKAPASDSISIFQNISLEFTAELNESSVDSTTAYITDSLGTVFGSEVEVDELNSSKITFIPHRYFSPDSNYTIVITTGIKDIIGRSLSENFYHVFSTQAQDVEIATLFVKSTKPTNNKTDIDPSSDFYIEFNRFISPGNVADNQVLELRDSNGTLIDGVSNVFNSTISFIPSVDLNVTQNYTLRLINSVSDMFGNIYDVDSNISSWDFSTTDQTNSYNKKGISRISEYDLAKSSYVVRTLKQTSTNSIVAIGTISGIELYKITYVVPFTKPVIALLYTHQLPSKVNSIATFGDSFIIAGTRENGVYSFEAGELGLTEKSHFPLSETIYGVSLGKTIDGTIDRAYAVGPEHGMSIYALYSDATMESLNHIDQNNSIMIDVADVIGYDEATMSDKRRIYVADYNDAMLVYDENGTLEVKVDINGSVRKILPIQDYMGYITGVSALSATGIVKVFDLNGSASIFSDLELPLKVSNANSFIDYTNLISKSFISDKNRGVVLLDTYSEFYQDSIILYPDGIISSSVIYDSIHNINYLVGVSENGKLGLYNIIPDTTSPQIVSTIPINNETVDANISISVTIQDEKLDFTTLNNSSFELLDLNTSQSVSYDLNVSGNYDSAVCTLTPQSQLEDKNYKLIIKNTISDIVGNTLNNGTNVEVSFNVKTTPIVIPDISVSDISVFENNSTASFVVTLSEPIDKNVTVDFATSAGNALGGFDYVDTNGTLTIPAGSTSGIIDVNLINDYVLEGVETFELVLSNPSTNANLLINSAIATIVEDASDIVNVTLSGDTNVTEGFDAIYTISLSQPALTDLYVDVNLTHISSTSTDISTLQAYYTVFAGSSSAVITLPIVDDNISDGIDLYAISLTGTSSGGSFEGININTTEIQTQIIDNDISSLSISDAMADENESVIKFSVTMDKVADENVTFSYSTLDTNTTGGSDYIAVSSVATIPTGSTSVDLNVSILNDTISEGLELFIMNISSPSSNAVIAVGSAIGSIYDEAIVMANDFITGVEDFNITGNVLDNDIGDGLQVATFSVGPDINVSAGTTAFGAEIYEFLLNPDGSFLFNPTSLDLNGTIKVSYTTTASTEANLTIDIPNDNIDALYDYVGPATTVAFNALDNDEANVTSIVSATVSTTVSTPVLTDANLTLGTSLPIDYSGYSIYVTVDSNGSITVDNQTMIESDYITITYTTNTGSIGTSVVQSVYFGAP